MESAGKRKKHVLIIVENGTVPVDRRPWREAKALLNNNYEVTIICPRSFTCNEKYEYKEGIHIYRHSIPREKESTVGYLREYFAALLCEWFLSFRIFTRKPFDVIHACNPPDNIFLIGIFYKLLGVKFIFDHHDLVPEQYLLKFGRKGFFYKALLVLEKLTFRLSDISIATNISYKEIAIQRESMTPDKVFIVRNGPELDKFKSVSTKKSLKYGKKFLIGYIGEMGKQEGIDSLLKVMKYIIEEKKRKDIHLTCIGKGPALNYLRKLSENMNLSSYVNFTGFIPDKEAFEILRTSDICVNPDTPSEFNDKSTMVKVMEYMAFGKPIVQFDLKEGRFSAQEASLYAKKGSITDFAEKILKIIDNNDLAKKMGDIGIKRIREKLDWKYSIPNLLKAYKALQIK